jgi:hypothetical protein
VGDDGETAVSDDKLSDPSSAGGDSEVNALGNLPRADLKRLLKVPSGAIDIEVLVRADPASMADARGFQHQEAAAVAGAWLTLSNVRMCTRAFGLRWSSVCVYSFTHTRPVHVDTCLMITVALIDSASRKKVFASRP